MKRRCFLAAFVLGSLLIALAGTAPAVAQDDLKVEISSFTVTNFDGSDVTDGQLMAGNSYIVEFSVDVGVDLANNTLLLSTDLEKVEDVYWHLDNDYPGVDTDTWQPGLSVIEFNIVKGTAEFTLRGKVPDTYTSRTIPETGAVLHIPRDIALLQLFLGPSETLIEERAMNVIDQAISTYEKTLITCTTEVIPEFQNGARVSGEVHFFRAMIVFNLTGICISISSEGNSSYGGSPCEDRHA